LNKKNYFIIIIGILVYVYIMMGEARVPLEEVATITGIGYDIERNGEDMMEYSIPISTNVYKSNGTQVNLVFKEQGQNLGEVIQKRQEMMSQKFVQGHERIVLVSEDYARYGLKTLIEERFRNAEVNDIATMAVCKGRSEDYLKYKIRGHSNSSEYIEGLIVSSVNYNFFSDNYKQIDAFVRIGAEGRNLVLPYLEITEEGIEITGMAIFKGDKLIGLANIKESRMLNLLKNDRVKGIESLQKSTKVYIDFDAKSDKRKIECNKRGDKYSFKIDLSLKGTIVDNEMFVDMIKDIKAKKKFEKDMEKSIEKQCNDFIFVMKNNYNTDCIGLGREAAAKYGRQKVLDWNKVVCSSDIKVNVKVIVDLQGRGDY